MHLNSLNLEELGIAFSKAETCVEDSFCRLCFPDADGTNCPIFLLVDKRSYCQECNSFPLTNTGSLEVIILETDVASYPSCCS